MEITKRPKYVGWIGGYMEVFQEDLELISTYTLEQLTKYIENIEDSLKNLQEDDVLDIDYKGESRIECLKNPFALFMQSDPGANYYQISITPHTEETKNDFNIHDSHLSSEQKAIFEEVGIGKYVKQSYDGGDDVVDTLNYYKDFMIELKKKIEFTQSLQSKLSTKDELALAVGETGLKPKEENKKIRKL